MTELQLRQAGIEDTLLLWEWANDAVTRQASFSPTQILWEDHCIWFQQMLKKQDALIFLGVDGNDDLIGYVRFEQKEQQCVLSIAIAPHKRGKGWAKKIVSAGLTHYLGNHPGECIHVFVKVENAPSIALFRGLHWREVEEVSGSPALHFVFNPATCAP